MQKRQDLILNKRIRENKVCPEISVVMTSYNHEKYIDQAIESVLNQSFTDLELIIVDDASRDCSPGIIRRYEQQDGRIRGIFHAENRGISVTTNDGFDAASGRFIAYMQSDDLWMPEKLEIQMQIARKYPDRIIWSDALIIDREGNSKGMMFTEKYKADKKNKSGDLLADLASGNYICGQSLLLKTEYIRQIQFDPRLVFASDYKFALELASRFCFRFIPRPLVRYRIHGENAIFRNQNLWDKDLFKINKFILKQFGGRIPETVETKIYYRIGRYLYERNHFRFANRYLFESVRRNPRKTTYYKRLIKSFLSGVLK